MRISRSRSVLSFVRANSIHSAWVSPSATEGEYALSARFPYRRPGEGAHPDGEGGRRHGDHPLPRLPRPDRDERQTDRYRSEKRCQRHALSLLRRCADRIDGQPRGVAQLVEHRSPKPGVAGSSPVAPAPLLLASRGPLSPAKMLTTCNEDGDGLRRRTFGHAVSLPTRRRTGKRPWAVRDAPG